MKTKDEKQKKRSRVDDPTPPDPGGVQSSPLPVAPAAVSDFAEELTGA